MMRIMRRLESRTLVSLVVSWAVATGPFLSGCSRNPEPSSSAATSAAQPSPAAVAPSPATAAAQAPAPAPAAPGPAPGAATAQQLQEMVAPIALYPDTLI